MIDFLLGLWHNLPWIIRVPAELYFTIIFVRGIVASDITSWLEDKGLVKKGKRSLIYRSLDYIYDHIVWLADRVPAVQRKVAIWVHFRESHADRSVLHCSEGKCIII